MRGGGLAAAAPVKTPFPLEVCRFLTTIIQRLTRIGPVIGKKLVAGIVAV
jgi:hypothetical protein